MKALASMAVKFKPQSSKSQPIEGKTAWSNSPLVLVKPRPESEQKKPAPAEESYYCVLGYN